MRPTRALSFSGETAVLFSSSTFIFLFLPAVIIIYYAVLRGRTARNIFLSIASLFFYAWGEPWFVLVMMGSILANYFFGLLVERYRGMPFQTRLVIISSLIFTIGLIFVFKYLSFLMGLFVDLTGAAITVPEITLPIGISFFTFQAISYVIDVYRGHGHAQTNPMNVCLYISFFPQLIAGPIVRYETVAYDIEYRQENLKDFSQGFTRFIVGFAKKILLANAMGVISEHAFQGNGYSAEISVGLAWLGLFATGLQIFFDFSGYSDMAIGLGRMFGFHFLENFNYPFISKSLKEFWSRWHISLGSWFTDYVYIPLGGSRVSAPRAVFNLFVVWITTGLWHGASLPCLFWGLWFAVFISIEKFCKLAPFMSKSKVIGHIYTLLIFFLGLAFFQAPTIQDSWQYFGSLFGLNGNALIDDTLLFYLDQNKTVLFLCVLFSMPVCKWVNTLIESNPLSSKIRGYVYPAAMLVLMFVSISFMIKSSYNPFIYFNF